MLSLPKSHNIEGMLKFQFSEGEGIDFKGQTKTQFLEKIKHNLTTTVEFDDSEDQTDISAIKAPFTTLV